MSNIKKPCNVCNSSTFVPVKGTVRDLPDMEIFRCLTCGLVFLENFDHIDNLFYQNSKMNTKVTKSWKHYLDVCERDDSRRLEFLKNKLPDKKLLDFGCGAGGFLLKAKAITKVPVVGIELDSSLRKKVEDQCITDLSIVSKIEDLGDTKYDLITMFHVLEHLVSPQETVLKLKKHLNKKGKLIIEVPNSEDALLSLYDSESFSNFTYWSCHLYVYNENNLRKLLEDLDLKVDYVAQVQRYPLSNHLFWLAHDNPGGDNMWGFLDTPALTAAYGTSLAQINKCDTIIASVSL